MSVNTNAPSLSRKTRKTRVIDPAQLGLFDEPLATARGEPQIKPVAKPQAESGPPKQRAQRKEPVKMNPASKSAASGAILRVQDAATRVGLSVSTLNKMRCDGRGPRFIKLTGKIVGYAVEDLDAWVEKRRSVAGTSYSE